MKRTLHSLLPLLASVALSALPLTACDTSEGETADEVSPLVGAWQVTFKEGVTLPDVQNFDDPYGGGLERVETRGEVMIFADLTGYMDIIEENYFSDRDEPNIDYQVWDLRVLERNNPEKIHLRIIRRDDLRMLDCKIGNNQDRLTCTDPDAIVEENPEDPDAPDVSAWEFIKS